MQCFPAPPIQPLNPNDIYEFRALRHSRRIGQRSQFGYRDNAGIAGLLESMQIPSRQETYMLSRVQTAPSDVDWSEWGIFEGTDITGLPLRRADKSK
jgi:hypothetical protein